MKTKGEEIEFYTKEELIDKLRSIKAMGGYLITGQEI